MQIMLRIALSIFVFLFHFETYSQTVSTSKRVVLLDSVTKWTYILDTSHTYVTAFNQFGDSVWMTNVYWKGSKYHKPGVTSISLGVGEKGETIIWVGYERCGGVINLKIGKFQMIGCD